MKYVEREAGDDDIDLVKEVLEALMQEGIYVQILPREVLEEERRKGDAEALDPFAGGRGNLEKVVRRFRKAGAGKLIGRLIYGDDEKGEKLTRMIEIIVRKSFFQFYGRDPKTRELRKFETKVALFGPGSIYEVTRFAISRYRRLKRLREAETMPAFGEISIEKQEEMKIRSSMKLADLLWRREKLQLHICSAGSG